MVKFQPSTLAMWVRFPLPALKKGDHSRYNTAMKASTHGSIAKFVAIAMITMTCLPSMAVGEDKCRDISNDVKAAVEKDPAKVLMVVEDALVINEGCAGEIVKAAITASKADTTQADQIVQTALSVAPKMAFEINDAALSLVPGLTAVKPVEQRPVTVSGKNPDKNPVLDSPEPEKKTLDSPEPFVSFGPVRGLFLFQSPITGRLPVSPSTATP